MNESSARLENPSAGVEKPHGGVITSEAVSSTSVGHVLNEATSSTAAGDEGFLGKGIIDDLPQRKILLTKGVNGLGFNIRGGIDAPYVKSDKGIFIVKIHRDGAAFKDGRLRVGDKVLSLNGVALDGLRHEEVVSQFLSAGDVVRLHILQGAGPVLKEFESLLQHSVKLQRKNPASDPSLSTKGDASNGLQQKMSANNNNKEGDVARNRNDGKVVSGFETKDSSAESTESPPPKFGESEIKDSSAVLGFVCSVSSASKNDLDSSLLQHRSAPSYARARRPLRGDADGEAASTSIAADGALQTTEIRKEGPIGFHRRIDGGEDSGDDVGKSHRNVAEIDDGGCKGGSRFEGGESEGVEPSSEPSSTPDSKEDERSKLPSLRPKEPRPHLEQRLDDARGSDLEPKNRRTRLSPMEEERREEEGLLRVARPGQNRDEVVSARGDDGDENDYDDFDVRDVLLVAPRGLNDTVDEIKAEDFDVEKVSSRASVSPGAVVVQVASSASVVAGAASASAAAEETIDHDPSPNIVETVKKPDPASGMKVAGIVTRPDPRREKEGVEKKSGRNEESKIEAKAIERGEEEEEEGSASKKKDRVLASRDDGFTDSETGCYHSPLISETGCCYPSSSPEADCENSLTGCLTLRPIADDSPNSSVHTVRDEDHDVVRADDKTSTRRDLKSAAVPDVDRRNDVDAFCVPDTGSKHADAVNGAPNNLVDVQKIALGVREMAHDCQVQATTMNVSDTAVNGRRKAATPEVDVAAASPSNDACPAQDDDDDDDDDEDDDISISADSSFQSKKGNGNTSQHRPIPSREDLSHCLQQQQQHEVPTNGLESPTSPTLMTISVCFAVIAIICIGVGTWRIRRR